MVYQLRSFELDTFPADLFNGVLFDGYTSGARCSMGWQIPHFPKESADALVEAVVAKGVTARYDEASDTYIFRMSEDTGDEDYPGFDIQVDGVAVHVYAIGASCWCWDFPADPADDPEDEA